MATKVAAAFDYGDNHYRAEVVRWLDGDTAILRTDLGQNIYVEGSYRLNRLNAPEVHAGPGITAEQLTAGAASKAHVEQVAPAGTMVWIQTRKADKYGRYLAEVWIQDGSNGWKNLNDGLLADGFAKPYDGTGVKPV